MNDHLQMKSYNICPSLTSSAAVTLIHAFITFRMDLSNSILDVTSSKLQSIQKSVPFRSPTPAPVTTSPLSSRTSTQHIQFKILLLTSPARPLPTSHMCSTTTSPHAAPPHRTRHQTWAARARTHPLSSLFSKLPSAELLSIYDNVVCMYVLCLYVYTFYVGFRHQCSDNQRFLSSYTNKMYYYYYCYHFQTS